jgi:hypothetical protein
MSTEEHNPHNRQDESFDRPGVAGPHSAYKQTLSWLRANGIDPSRVAGDACASMVDGQVTLVMKLAGPDGRSDVIDPEGTGVLKETRTFPVTVPPPPLVAAWLAPKCPTCGR